MAHRRAGGTVSSSQFMTGVLRMETLCFLLRWDSTPGLHLIIHPFTGTPCRRTSTGQKDEAGLSLLHASTSRNIRSWPRDDDQHHRGTIASHFQVILTRRSRDSIKVVKMLGVWLAGSDMALLCRSSYDFGTPSLAPRLVYCRTLPRKTVQVFPNLKVLSFFLSLVTWMYEYVAPAGCR